MRFQDKNFTLFYFDNEIFVECPQCHQRATVTKDVPFSYFSPRTLKCPNCLYSQKGRKTIFEIEVKCSCSNCGSVLNVHIPNVNKKKDSIAVKCHNCGNTEKYAPRNIAQEQKFVDTDKPSDNYFGLPLWLSKNFKGNIFWAFNYSHLEYLKSYISAELRERNGRRGWTMVEKLPAWMKSGKNRTDLIKMISVLEKK
jgi:DNA-directed RNA polymerase subunit M/transcription elongation factor TFIIS